MRLKDLVYINSSTLPEDTNSSYCFNYIDISSVSGEGGISMDTCYNFGEAPSRARRIVKKGDVLISTVRTYLRAIAAIDFDAKDIVASTGFAVCSPKKNIASKYLSYAVRNNLVIADICKESTGVSYPAIPAARLSSIEIPFCEIAEQRAIADYLDKKTAEIDVQVALLEKKRESYNKLKRNLISKVVAQGLNPTVALKDSGIDCFGKIPTHWKVKRLKDVASLYTGNSLNDKQKEYYATHTFSKALPYIGSKDIEQGVGKINYEGDYRIPVGENKFRVAPDGSSLLCVEGGSAGKKIGYIEHDACFVNKLCCIDSRLNKRYVFHYLHSLEFINQFNPRLQGMIGGVAVNVIKAMNIAIPPLAEQQAIADYLDNKTAEIDEQIALIDKKIDTYKKLKQSLIDEVVTGKRKIQ